MKKIIILLLALLPALTMKAQMLAVHTDVAALALQTYNLGAEMNINNRSTLNLDVMHTDNPYWARSATGITIVQPELRYYFGGRPMYHHFMGVSLLAANYKLNWKDIRHKGIAAGAGLTLGYVFALGHNFTIDAHTGIGIIVNHDRERDFTGKNKWGYYIAPTKVGITLSYIIR